MFRIMLQKMWQKRWLNLSLLLGCILLIATTVSFPLYEEAAYDKMLQDEFRDSFSVKGYWPMTIKMATMCNKDKSSKTVNKMEGFMQDIYGTMGVDEKLSIMNYSLSSTTVTSDLYRDDGIEMSVILSSMTDLENHAKLVNGQMYSELGVDETGALEVVVTQTTMVNKGFILGETLTFDSLKDADKNPIRIVIKGVITNPDENDYYFDQNIENLFNTCFVNMNAFREFFLGENSSRFNINCQYTAMFDYERVEAKKVEDIISTTEYLTNKSAFRSVIKDPEYSTLLDGYLKKKARISATLIILQVPVLVLLSAFLIMISSQMYELERNEISVIKSRGSTGAQIFRLYTYQGIVLTVLGAIFGVPLGMVFSRILGSAKNFLEFDSSIHLNISLNIEVLWYLIVAMAITLFSIAFPAIKHSKVSIVNLKQQKAVNKKTLWEKLFIDVLLLGISLYGYYSFNKNMSDLSLKVLEGESLDPLLYLSSSLFIVGAGLLALRFQPFIIKLLYIIFGKRSKPATYISLMENMKNGRKMFTIMLFMIMTISLGIFHAAVARTILENALDNTKYKNGADVVFKENWPEMVDQEGKSTGNYIEPDYSRFAAMKFANAYTKVYFDEHGYLGSAKGSRTDTTIMGIHTKEFGLMTIDSIDDEILAKPYFEYLNELAVVENGVILSTNYNSVLGYNIGDTLNFHDSYGNLISGTVVDFMDYFPTYAPSSIDLNPDGTAYQKDNYLIVMNYSYLKKETGNYPYEVWIDTKDETTDQEIVDFLNTNNITLKKYVNMKDSVDATLFDPLLQGTNGVLTMGFMVTIILCAVGYLIYWIMSVKNRELIFGVLRAEGLHKGELLNMVINEHLFTGLFSVIMGIVIGNVTSKMFVPILQTSYSSAEQMIPMRIIKRASDMYRLYGIVGAVLVISVAILIMLLFRMNVTKALKLGEE